MALKKDLLLKCLFLFILIIASFFRLYQLDIIPPGLYPDEAINANEALETLKTKSFKLFYPQNNGREGVFLWIIAFSFLLFEVSVWSFRVVPAIFGILTVFGTYFLAKELFWLTTDNEKKAANIALLASFFLSVSFWHVNFSRIGFRAILLPFVLVFSFYFLFRGCRKLFYNKKVGASNFIISGIFFGLGVYTYASFRVAIVIPTIIIALFLLLFKNKGLEKKFGKILYFSLFSTIVSLPLGIFFIKNPEYFMSRASQVFVFSQQNPIKAFFESLVLHLGMFNFYGDGNWRHNLSGSPQLLWPVGILFLIGFFIVIKNFFHSLKNKNLLLLTCCLLPLTWFFIMLSPGILTYEGIPHSLRTIGVIPIVYIFAGFGAWETYLFFNRGSKNKNLLILTSLVFLLMVSVLQFDKYFVKWGQSLETQNAFSNDYVRIGNYLNSIPDKIQKIVIVNRGGVPVPWPDGIPMPAQTIMFIENTKPQNTPSVYLKPEEIKDIDVGKKSTIILPMAYDEAIFKQLKEIFPQGKVNIKNNILIFQINN